MMLMVKKITHADPDKWIVTGYSNMTCTPEGSSKTCVIRDMKTLSSPSPQVLATIKGIDEIMTLRGSISTISDKEWKFEMFTKTKYEKKVEGGKATLVLSDMMH